MFTILLVLVSETYYYYYVEKNEILTVGKFTKVLIDAVGFSIFVNTIIFVSNYFVNRKSKTKSS
jgi:glucose uptake protein GlcU